jgi:hypothetical protein
VCVCVCVFQTVRIKVISATEKERSYAQEWSLWSEGLLLMNTLCASNEVKISKLMLPKEKVSVLRTQLSLRCAVLLDCSRLPHESRGPAHLLGTATHDAACVPVGL